MTVAAFDNTKLMLQFLSATTYLARDMRNNAQQHLAWLSGKLDGSSGNPVLSDVAQFMNDCAVSYLNIIAQGQTFVANNNAAATSACALIGASLSDLNSYVLPLKTAAQNLQAADKTTVANAQAACNAVLSAVTAPPGVFTQT